VTVPPVATRGGGTSAVAVNPNVRGTRPKTASVAKTVKINVSANDELTVMLPANTPDTSVTPVGRGVVELLAYVTEVPSATSVVLNADDFVTGVKFGGVVHSGVDVDENTRYAMPWAPLPPGY
jgi:hypothetical protein